VPTVVFRRGRELLEGMEKLFKVNMCHLVPVVGLAGALQAQGLSATGVGPKFLVFFFTVLH